MTAYSTAVGPSSETRNFFTLLANFCISSTPKGNQGVDQPGPLQTDQIEPAAIMKVSRCSGAATQQQNPLKPRLGFLPVKKFWQERGDLSVAAVPVVWMRCPLPRTDCDSNNGLTGIRLSGASRVEERSLGKRTPRSVSPSQECLLQTSKQGSESRQDFRPKICASFSTDDAVISRLRVSITSAVRTPARHS